MSEYPASLAEAMAILQTRLPKIDKRKTASIKSDKGSYGYKYADLADVEHELMPLMGELGLSFVAMPTLTTDGKFVLAYRLLHVSGVGEIEGQYPLKMESTPQGRGSEITYARRYCLTSVTGAVADEDDDGSSAQAEPRQRQQRQARPTPQSATPPAEMATDSTDDERLRKTMARMHILFQEAGYKADDKGRAERLALVVDTIGRPVESSKELTLREAQTVIHRLSAYLQAAPQGGGSE